MKNTIILVLALFCTLTFAQEDKSKPTRQNAYQATINGQQTLEIKTDNKEVLTIEVLEAKKPFG